MLINRKTTIAQEPQQTWAASNWGAVLLRADWLAALALLLVWFAMLAGAPLALPTQAASWLTFLGLLIAPGFLLGNLLVERTELDLLERLALAFPLGMAVLALPGMAGLLLHWTVEQLALVWVFTTGIVAGVWLIWSANRLWQGNTRPGAPGAGWKPDEWILLAVIALGFAVALPALMLHKIDGDAYAVNAFAADALAGLPLNLNEPIFGTQLGPGVRMAFNQSLPMSYLWSHFSGLDANTLTAAAARPMIALWSILSVYMLGQAAGQDLSGPVRGRRFALLVAAIHLLIYLAAPFLRGDNVSLFFFERTTADKFMVPVTMLPVVFALSMRFLRLGLQPDPDQEGTGRALWAAAAIATFAVSAIHPLIAAMLALGLGAFAGLHVLLHWRSRSQWGRAAWLGGLIVIVMTLPLVQLVLANGEDPLPASYPESLEDWPVGYRMVPALPYVQVPTLDVYGPLPQLSQLEPVEVYSESDPFLVWRFAVNMERRRLLLFSLDRYISDPNLLLEPPYLLALLLLPLLLPAIRRNLGAQFAVSTALAVLVVMFNPLITPLIGSLVMPWILWRFVWLLPYALILALVLAPALGWLASKGASAVQTERRHWGRWAALAGVLALALALSPLVMRNMQTLRERAAYPYFYPTPTELFDRLDELTQTGDASVVMADQDLSVSLPAFVPHAHIIAHRAPTTSEVFPADRQEEALQRLIDQASFFQTRFLTPEILDILQRYDVAYVVAPSGSNLEIQLQLAPDWFEWVMDDQSYSLYKVRDVPSPTPAVLGNSALAERQWDQATEYYELALDENPDDLLAHAGLAEIAHARGRFDEALSHYQAALALVDRPVLHYRLGQLYTQLGRVAEAVDAFDRAQQAAPNVARYHVATADACLRADDQDCAGEHFAQAVANGNLPDKASEWIALADLWRQQGRTDQALNYYELAVEESPSLANRLMLGSAYLEEEQFAKAAALMRLTQAQHPLSIDALRLAAEIAAARGDIPEAVRIYHRALFLQNITGRSTVETRLGLANVLADAGRSAEAQRQLDQVLRLNPNLASAHTLQGEVHSALGKDEEAIEAYQDAFRLDPTQVQLYLALSSQFREMGGQQTELLDLLERAQLANPDEPTLALALGEQLQRQGEIERAIDAYQSALDKFDLASLSSTFTLRASDASRAYAYTRLAAVSEDLGLTEPAMNYYSAAVAAAGEQAWPHLLHGDALRRRNDTSGAEAAYRRAIAIDPTFPNTYVQLAEVLEARGNSVEANALRQQALDVAYTQAASPQIAQTTGLAAGFDPASSGGNVQSSFNSDSPAPSGERAVSGGGSNSASQSTANQVDQLLGELSGEGGALFAGGSGLGVLDLLTRLVQTTGEQERAIALYQRALEQGRQEGWPATILAQYHKGLGDLHFAQDQPSLAVDAYRQAIALDSWWPQAQMGLARAYERLGQQDVALAQLEEAVRVAPGYVEAQVALADYYEEAGQLEKALALYRKTAAEHPGNPQATLALAQAQQARGEYDEAERVYRRTLAHTPGNSEAYVELARLLIAQARYIEAEPMLLAALETNQRNVNAHMQMGVLAQAQGRQAEALEWFKRAARVTPEQLPRSGGSRLVLIDLLQRYGHYELSLTYLREEVSRDPTNVEMLLREARAQRILGRTGEALATLLDAAQRNMSSAALSAELGELYVAQGRPDAALAAYRQTVALDPGEDAYYIRLSELWESQAMFDEAESILRSGLSQAQQPASLYAALADLYLSQGKTSEAKQMLDDVMARMGELPVLVAAMGAYHETQAVQGMAANDRAETWYKSYLAGHPDDSTIRMALGEHYLRRENVEEAITQYEQVLDLQPANADVYLAAAEAYRAADRTADAEAALQRGITLEPTQAESYLSLANLHLGQDDLQDAERVLNQARELLPANGPIQVAHGKVLARQGREDAALAHLAQLDQLAPTVDMLRARAQVYVTLQRTDAALRDLENARRKAPGSLDVLLALGDLHRDLDNVEEAKAVYADATNISPGLAAGRVRMAQLER